MFEFRPGNPVLREEFAKIVAVAYDVYNPSATSAYSDCNAGSWYTPYVGSIENEGLTIGIGEGKYGVGENMSRQDAAKMLSRTMVKYQSITLPDVTSAETTVSVFDDAIDIASYAKQPVAFFVNVGIIKGNDNGAGGFIFRPKANITRAEISKIICMSLNYASPTPTPI